MNNFALGNCMKNDSQTKIRKSGVLMPVFSLPSGYGCGNFGKYAYDFVDFLAAGGFSVWQVLPLCLTNSYNSPYMSPASFFGNPNFIDLEDLYNQGLLSESELASQREQSPYLCEYERLNKERLPLIVRAAARCKNRGEIERFCDKRPAILQAVTYLALKQANGEKPFYEWENTEVDKEYLFALKFTQYHFYTQWQKLKDYANNKGVKIFGDLPFYVAPDSADVYFGSKAFMLGSDKKPKEIAGVPPDYFAADGQLWGNPVYNWAHLRSDGYGFWKDRISGAKDLYDIIRLDHFRAFSRFWSVPNGAATAKDGRFVKGGGKGVIDAIKSAAGGCALVAENLGIIDKDVDDLLDYSGFYGMAVFQFGFDGNPNNPHLPHNYTQKTVAYTGTHDNNTLLGFMWEQPQEVRNSVMEYVGFTGDFNQSYESIIRALLTSAAGLVILPVQDLLGFGGDTRINTPGKADGNWAFRLSPEGFAGLNADRFYKLNHTYGRI